VLLVLVAAKVDSQVANCPEQPMLTNCYWYKSSACCTLAQDQAIGVLMANITAYNAKNIPDETMRQACDYRMSLYVCKPCAPTGTLPTCTPLCMSISYRCGTDYTDNLLAALNYTLDLSTGDSCQACTDANTCSTGTCWNFASYTKATLIVLLLPVLLLVL